jgi:SAM-dependent methyltransferase
MKVNADAMINLPISIKNHARHDVCPVCRSPEIAQVGALDCQGPTYYSSCVIQLSRIPELWRCAHCGSGFVQNIIDELKSRQLYSIGAAGERWSPQLFDQNKTRIVVSKLRLLFRPGIRLLDIGANTGELLDFAQQAGCYTAGLEYSDSSRSILRDKGHAPHVSFAEAGSGYDFITAFDLVEHLYDVPGFLQACHERLVDGGRLVILTGDIFAPSARLAAEHWWYAQYPEHIVFPSRTYLSNLPMFRMQYLYRTYASVRHQRRSFLGLAQMILKRIQGRCYSGWPSLGPDHILAILQKV